MPVARPTWLGLCLGLLLTGAANAQASFQGLGSLPGASAGSTARDISGDGAVVVGRCPASATCTEAWRWTQAGGITGIGFLPGEEVSSAVATSFDGGVVFGTSGAAIFRWTPGGMVDISSGLPEGPNISLAPQDLSDDGLVAVGGFIDYDTLAGGSFRWTSGLGIEVLIPFTLPSLASFRAVSADGSVVVGSSGIFDDPMPFHRTDAGGIVFLPELPVGNCQCGSEAIGVSADGQTIVGRSYQEPFRWTAASGTTSLGVLPDPLQFNDFDAAHDVSSDGNVIVGTSWRVGFTKAFLWTEAEGIRALQIVLVQRGIDLGGWTLTSAEAVSDDGRWIAGNGINPSGDPEAWIAHVPAVQSVPSLPPSAIAVLSALLGAIGAATLRATRRPFDRIRTRTSPAARLEAWL